MALSRRQVLAAGAGLAVAPLVPAVAGCSSGGSPSGGPAPLSGAALAGSAPAHLHIVAHADDSLFFHSPELAQSLASGHASVAVVLTGGESDGTNGSSHRHYGPLHDRPAFVRARMNGLRAATALLATGDAAGPWRMDAVTLLSGSGIEVERNTLVAAPQVQIYWLQLVEARSVSAPNPVSLKALWLGALDELPTLRPEESPVPDEYAYTRSQVVDSLTALLELHRPTAVRTLDPNPEHRVPQPGDWGGRAFVPEALRLPVYLDHQDHQYSAYFAQAALRAYWAGGRARPATVEHYLGYVNTWLPVDQDHATTAAKQQALAVYGWAGGRPCGDPVGCGDLKVGMRGAHGSWSRAVRHRAPGAASWAQPLADGRLAAFTLLGDGVAVWVEGAPGNGRWSGPHQVAGASGALGTGELEGQLEVVRLADQRLRLLGVRTRLAGSPSAHGREVVTCEQTAVDGGGVPVFGAWQSLGCPDGDGLRSMEMGYPVAAVDGRGAVHVFVRDWSGGVSVRAQGADGTWGAWGALSLAAGVGTDGASAPVPGVMDGLGVTAVGTDGGVAVFAAAPNGLVGWVMDGTGAVSGGELLELPLGSGAVSAAAEAVPEGGVNVRVAYYGVGSGVVRLADLRLCGSGSGCSGPGGGAAHVTAPLPFGGAAWRESVVGGVVGGFGRVALVSGGGRTLVAARDGGGGVGLAVGGDVPAGWAHGVVPLAHAPALAVDARGRGVAFAMGSDGLLWTARQGGSGAAPLGAWRAWEGG